MHFGPEDDAGVDPRDLIDRNPTAGADIMARHKAATQPTIGEAAAGVPAPTFEQIMAVAVSHDTTTMAGQTSFAREILEKFAALRATPATAAEPVKDQNDIAAIEWIEAHGADSSDRATLTLYKHRWKAIGKVLRKHGLPFGTIDNTTPQAVVVDAVEVSDEGVIRKGLSRLAHVVNTLRETGRFVDDEGDDTEALADLGFELSKPIKGQQPDVSANIQEVAEGAGVRTMEDCPELNMNNFTDVDVDRLNDWAIRADAEIDRLVTTPKPADEVMRCDYKCPGCEGCCGNLPTNGAAAQEPTIPCVTCAQTGIVTEILERDFRQVHCPSCGGHGRHKPFDAPLAATSTMPADVVKDPFVIYLDADPIDVGQVYRAKGFQFLPPNPTMSGAEIRSCGWKKNNYQMYIDATPMQPVGDTEAIPLKSGMKFFCIPEANW